MLHESTCHNPGNAAGKASGTVNAYSGRCAIKFTDEQWNELWDVALRKALTMTHGDFFAAEDIVASVVERLILLDEESLPSRLKAYTRMMVRNAYLNMLEADSAAYRQGGSVPHPMDETIHLLADALAGSGVNPTYGVNSSMQVIDREEYLERRRTCERILESLPPRKRELLVLSMEGVPQSEIAEKLGYANADVVKVTLQRVLKDIRDNTI